MPKYKITCTALGCLLFHRSYMHFCYLVHLVSGLQAQIPGRFTSDYFKSVSQLKNGENWNSHTHFLEWCWTKIPAELHANLIWKHEWSPKFKTLRFRLLSMYVLLPGDGRQATADLIRDVYSVVRSYLWQEVDQSTGKETNQRCRPKDISLTRQHCCQSDKHDLSWSVGC